MFFSLLLIQSQSDKVKYDRAQAPVWPKACIGNKSSWFPTKKQPYNILILTVKKKKKNLQYWIFKK